MTNQNLTDKNPARAINLSHPWATQRFEVSTCDLKRSDRLTLFATEQGVAMLSSVLNSECAVQVNIEIMRIFVRLRQLIASHKELAAKLLELETRYDLIWANLLRFSRLRKLTSQEDVRFAIIVHNVRMESLWESYR